VRSEHLKLAFRFLRKHISIILSVTLIATFGILVFFSYIFDLQWTGIPAYYLPVSSTKQYQPAKTLWEWLQLLIIPVGLFLVAYWFNRAERRNDRDNTLDNQRQAVLQTYTDQVSELLLKEDFDEDKEKS
jgi:hypothetical protein